MRRTVEKRSSLSGWEEKLKNQIGRRSKREDRVDEEKQTLEKLVAGRRQHHISSNAHESN
eukprot:754595-Hanusia_phi.AAC.1